MLPRGRRAGRGWLGPRAGSNRLWCPNLEPLDGAQWVTFVPQRAGAASRSVPMDSALQQEVVPEVRRLDTRTLGIEPSPRSAG